MPSVNIANHRCPIIHPLGEIGNQVEAIKSQMPIPPREGGFTAV